MVDVFEKYRRMQGKMTIKVDGVEFQLAATINDKKEFIRIKDAISKGKLTFDALFDWGLALLKKSYPTNDPAELESLLTFNSNEFFDELSIGFGFIPRARLQQLYDEQYGKSGEKKNDAGGVPA